MNGSDLNKIKLRIIENLTKALGEKLMTIVLTGSLSRNSYKDGWSDVDLLIVIDDLNFDIKQKVAGAVGELENSSSIHHGVNVISMDEFFNPVLPDILLDGKTLQALIDLKKYPDRLIYCRGLTDTKNIYSPSNEVLKNYSLSNMGIFLRRNRKTLTAASYNNRDIKELLKREIRASLIITKLAVQYFTAIPQENYQEVLNLAKSLFTDFDFKVIEDNFRIIEKWHELNDKGEILDTFRKVDDYIEKFTHYVFKKSQNN